MNSHIFLVFLIIFLTSSSSLLFLVSIICVRTHAYIYMTMYYHYYYFEIQNIQQIKGLHECLLSCLFMLKKNKWNYLCMWNSKLSIISLVMFIIRKMKKYLYHFERKMWGNLSIMQMKIIYASIIFGGWVGFYNKKKYKL